jgi:hypothetical protein
MDAIQALNQAPIKAIFVSHFMLTTWALLGNWLPNAYLYYNSMLMITLLWSIHARDSHEPVLLAIILNFLSIVFDAITIGVYYDLDHNHAVWFGFTLFITIANLLLRPISSLVMLRVYNERCGRYSSFGFPGLSGLNPTGSVLSGGGGGVGAGTTGRGSYENIDSGVPHQSVPSPIRDIDSNIPSYNPKSY